MAKRKGKMDKNLRNLIIFIICFVTLIFIQKIHMYGFQDTEIVDLETTYVDPDTNWTYTINFEVNVVKPILPSIKEFPVCILLHGDGVKWQSMNMIKLEFLYNGYMTVLLNIRHQPEDFLILNDTLDYLLGRADVNKDQICIMGASHGATYALSFAAMRNDSISAVVLGNFPELFYFYTDYFEYYLKYVNSNTSVDAEDLTRYVLNPDNHVGYIPDELKNISLPISKNNPKNILLATNSYDYAPEYPLGLYMELLTDGETTQIEQLYGNYQDGSARELYVSKTFFMHVSSMVCPQSMYKITSWANSAFGIDNPHNQYRYTELRVSTEISILVFLYIFGGLTALTACGFLLKQEKFIKDFKNKRKRLKEGVVKTEDIAENLSGNDNNSDIIQDSVDQGQNLNLPGNKDLIKKLIKYLLIAECILIFFYFIYWNFLSLWFYDNNLTSYITMLFSPSGGFSYYGASASPYNFPEAYFFTPVAHLGFSISSVLINNRFPFTFMVFWTIALVCFLRNKTVQQAGFNKIRDYSINDFLKAAIIAIEVYILFHFVGLITLFDITGIYPGVIAFTNIFLAIFILVHLNQITFKLFYKEHSIFFSIPNFKMIGMTLLLYLPFIIPIILFSFYYFYLLPVAGVISIAFLNPVLKRKGFDLLTITIIDYFQILIISSLF